MPLFSHDKDLAFTLSDVGSHWWAWAEDWHDIKSVSKDHYTQSTVSRIEDRSYCNSSGRV